MGVTLLAECDDAVRDVLQENPRSELETINAVVVDADADGLEDVLFVNQLSSSVTLWRGGARAWSGTTTVSQGGFPQAVTLVDADRYGDLDLLATLGSGWAGVSGGNCTIVRFNDGAGNFA